jgi:hypothetical protein
MRVVDKRGETTAAKAMQDNHIGTSEWVTGGSRPQSHEHTPVKFSTDY